MQKRKKAKKSQDVLAGDRTPVGQLYRAVRRYVETHGGSIVVIGGIKLLQWPTGKFSISVDCLGQKPSCAEGKRDEHG